MWWRKYILQVAEPVDAPQLTSLRIASILGSHISLPFIPRKLQSLELNLNGTHTHTHSQSLGLFSATLTHLRLDDIVDLEELRHIQCFSALRYLCVECCLDDETCLTVEKDLAHLTALTWWTIPF